MDALPRQISLLRGATLPDGRRRDVVIAGDTVGEIRPADPTSDGFPAEGILDLTGFLLLTAPAEPHAHLDKAQSYDLISPPPGDLVAAISAWRAFALTESEEGIYTRTRRQALAMLQSGTTAIRSHVDVLRGGDPARGARALVRLRAELAGLLDLELVALPGPDTPDADIEAVLAAGVDLVGGAPHLAPDPLADLARLLALAERHQVGVDLHTDESLDGALTLPAFAAAVRGWPAGRTRSAGHCVRLSTLAAAELTEVITACRAGDIGVIACPITNLYLQGWEHPVATPRGLTPARRLLDAGVRFAAGADNVRDPFNPVGRSDALETASLLVTAGHLTLPEAYAAVSDGARSVLGRPVAGVTPGARADLLAVRAGSLSEAVASASPDRFVLHSGRLVASSRLTSAIATPARVPALTSTTT